MFLPGTHLPLGVQRFKRVGKILPCLRRLDNVVHKPPACRNVGIGKRLSILIHQFFAAAGLILGGIDLAPATIDGLKSKYITATLDQLLYLQGFMPVVQCVMSAKYKMPGLSLNTGAGVVTPDTIGGLTQLIDAGIR